MKRFLLNISIVALTAAALMLACLAIDVHRFYRTDFSAGDSHILAIGPSTMACALNDTLLPGVRNISRDGTPYVCLTPLLELILDANPQIDTVWINHGRFQFLKFTDEDIDRNYPYMENAMPLLFANHDRAAWRSLLRNPYLYPAALKQNLKKRMRAATDRTLTGIGLGYDRNDRQNLHHDEADWSIAWYQRQTARHGGNEHTRQWIERRCANEHRMMEQAIELCRRRNVVPVLFFTPMYQYDRWFRIDGFLDYMTSLDSTLLVADYENFPFPSDTCYSDVHHLSHAGACHFSRHIARHGLHCIPMGEWIKSRKTNIFP